MKELSFTTKEITHQAGRLAFNKGAKLTVLDKRDKDLWLCELNGKQGLVPKDRLRILEANPSGKSDYGYKTTNGGYY